MGDSPAASWRAVRDKYALHAEHMWRVYFEKGEGERGDRSLGTGVVVVVGGEGRKGEREGGREAETCSCFASGQQEESWAGRSLHIDYVGLWQP